MLANGCQTKRNQQKDRILPVFLLLFLFWVWFVFCCFFFLGGGGGGC